MRPDNLDESELADNDYGMSLNIDIERKKQVELEELDEFE